MKTYEVKREPIVKDGKEIVKYNVYYYHNGELFTKEFHSYDGINGEVKQGYTLKEK